MIKIPLTKVSQNLRELSFIIFQDFPTNKNLKIKYQKQQNNINKLTIN